MTTEPPGASALLHAGAVATPMDASGCGAISPVSYPLPRKRLRLRVGPVGAVAVAEGAVALGALDAVGACAADSLRMNKSGWARKPQPLRRLGADGGRVAPTSLTRRGMGKLRLNRQFCYETLGGERDTQAHT